MSSSRHAPLAILSAVGAAALLVACGGGGGGGSASTTALSGSVVKGPVAGAEVCAYRATAAGKGDKIACVTTGSTGSYAMDIAYEGDVVVEASGGSYTDEATGKAATLDTPMQVVVRANGGNVTGVVTPLTSVAYSLAKGAGGGLTSAGFTTAATSVAGKFRLASVDIATATPTVSGTPDAYGRLLRAISQFQASGGKLAAFQAFSDPAALQAAFAAAYGNINGTTVSFAFGAGTTPPKPPATGGASCGITVSGSGTVRHNGNTLPFTLPATKICVTGLPAGSCEAGNSQLQDIAASGATPGGDYSINYSYAYAPGDCGGAAATMAYTQ
ncbi:MAG: hypothetical protein ACO1PB_02945 [Ramlibacter sp.]